MAPIKPRAAPLEDDVFIDSPSTSTAAAAADALDVAELTQRMENIGRERRPSDSLVPDPDVLNDLETYAQSISSNLDMALRDLRGVLRGISDLSLETQQSFNTIITGSCDACDTAIRAMYTVLAKSEELNVAMEGIRRLTVQIKDLKRLVDLLENHFASAPNVDVVAA